MKYKIREIAKTSSGATPLSTIKEFYDGGDIPWINSGELSNPYIVSAEKYITQKGFDSSSTKMYPPDTILLAMYGATAGKASILKLDACTNQAICALQIDETKADPYFIKYKLDSMYSYLVGLSTGSARNNLSQQGINEIEVDIPDLPTQKKIAKVLSDIDTKLSLNRRINERLEQVARQLYDYWFVQFDFPDANGNPYRTSGGKMIYNDKLKREIPEGWEVKNIFQATDVLYGFPFSTEKFVDFKTSIPVVRIRDIQSTTTSAFSTESVDEKYRLNIGDVVVGMDGNFHINFWSNNTDYLNQRCVRFRPNKDFQVASLPLIFQIQPYIKSREATIKGSTVAHLSDKDVKALFVLIPDFEIKDMFNKLLMQMVHNRVESDHLTALRDRLLPLLMNGQVTIKD